MSEYIHYTPLKEQLHENEAAFERNISVITGVYNGSGFPISPEGQDTCLAFVRGSTASYINTDGSIGFRHPRSDIDFVAVTTRPSIQDAGYFIIPRMVFDQKGVVENREVDVLYTPHMFLQQERQHPYRCFLTTKLFQPGLPLFGKDFYTSEKVEAVTSLLVRQAALHINNRSYATRLTPSGAAMYAVQGDLYAEPWRWTSFTTYYRFSPNADRQRRELSYFAGQALEKLESDGIAKNITKHYKTTEEPVYELDLSHFPDHLLPNSASTRIFTVTHFVREQLQLLWRNPQGLSLDNASRIFMKLRSFIHNPSMRYDADLIFGR